MNTKELLHKENLTKQEQAYLENFIIYENKDLEDAIRRCIKQGLDPVKLLRDVRLRREAAESIDV